MDPVIRAAMDVPLEGAVIIFDEAHNIEDQARCGARGSCNIRRKLSCQGLGSVVQFVRKHLGKADLF